MVAYAPNIGAYCPISKTPCPGVCIYADILENINLGIIVFDICSEKVIFQNKLALDIFAATTKPKDYEGLYSLLMSDLDELPSPSKPSLSRTLHYGTRLLGYTVYNVIEGYIWIFVQDVSEKVRLESIAEAVNTMENIGYIFSSIRHEIGNPINSIKMTMSVLKNNLEKFPKDTVAAYVDRVLTEIGRVEYLLKSLRNFNLYENPQRQRVKMDSFVENFMALVADDYKQKGIKLRTIIHPRAEWAYVDPRALQQVLLNILSNAADALKGREEPEIDIGVLRLNGRIKMLVADNGCGMTEEQQKHLFKPFYTFKTEGTGLGLVIVKKMLAQMNSTIEIKSYENAGTLVTISLPEGEVDDFIQ